MKRSTLFIKLALSLVSFSFSQTVPKMRYEDKIRIREAITISEQVGDKIWKGINKVPFAVLLVMDSIEFLVHHPNPSGDFKLSEDDKVLNTKILYRKRQYPNWYLATFPAVNGLNCIVVGIPEKTKKTSSDWIITLLHEHFHQYQFSSPEYYNEVNKLDLSGGDETGMWQLNYPFPYEKTKVIQQYNKYNKALLKAVSSLGKRSFKKHFANYLEQRKKFKSSLSPADYRYFSFQIWQEGIAKHTEYKFIEAMDFYNPSPEAKQLADFINFKELKNKFYTSELTYIANSKFEIDKRICFYAIGFTEGVLLDKQNPDWREKYVVDKFYIENYFNKK